MREHPNCGIGWYVILSSVPVVKSLCDQRGCALPSVQAALDEICAQPLITEHDKVLWLTVDGE